MKKRSSYKGNEVENYFRRRENHQVYVDYDITNQDVKKLNSVWIEKKQAEFDIQNQKMLDKIARMANIDYQQLIP